MSAVSQIIWETCKTYLFQQGKFLAALWVLIVTIPMVLLQMMGTQEVGEQFAFKFDGVVEGPVALRVEVFLAPVRRGGGDLLRQRMRTAGLREAAHQGVGPSVQKDRSDHDAFAAQFIDERQQMRQ